MNIKSIIICLVIFITLGCVSVAKYNTHIEQKIPVDKLKKDTDFVREKLERYHPKLDLYESKSNINLKFDSLKKSIDKPLKPNEFYFKISSIFEMLRHGHANVYPLYQKLNKKQINRYKKSKSAFQNYRFFYQNDSIFVAKDFSKETPLESGSVLLSIDSMSIDSMVNKYKHTIYADGYNKTFQENLFGKTFLNYVTLEQGIKDSTELTFWTKENIIKKKIYRKFDKSPLPKKKGESVKNDKPKLIQKQIRIKQKKYGYDKSTKTYSKNLSFPTNDSTVAVLKVVDFRKGKIRKLYKEVFTDIKKHKIEHLILDIRDNKGGFIRDAHYLYAYLVNEPKPFLGKKIVANKIAFGKAMYNLSPFPSYPILWIGAGYSFFSTSKNDQKEYELNIPFSHAFIDAELTYRNKLYVLINGGSYSASALLAANLHAKNRAFFVGEETGGDYNGTVAGLMPEFTLPYSKLKISLGTVYITPLKQRPEIGRGVYPDKKIKPTLDSRIQNKDIELEWLLDYIKNNQDNKNEVQH